MSRSDRVKPAPASFDYWQLFQELPESYLLFEAVPEYVIVDMNKAREQLLGVSREQAVGKPLFDVHPPLEHWYPGKLANDARRLIERVLETKHTQKLEALRYDILAADGSMQPHYWQSTYMPVRLHGRDISHILAVTREVTAEHMAVRQVAKTEERLEAALTIGKVGSWTWDLRTNIIVANTMMAKLFGVTPAEAAKGIPQEAFTGTVHKDDIDRVYAAMRRSIQGHRLFDEEYRIVAPGGRTQWVLARGKVDAAGQVFSGVIVDITERRDLQAEIALARQQDRLNRRAAANLQSRNDELEALARTKDEFVALASHQLRTPATAVKQYVGMVLQGYVGDISELQAEMLDKAFESNERQIQIINQILNAARADTGRLVMTPVPADLSALARGISDEMRPSLEQRQHHFSVRLPKTPVPVLADLGYMRMAIENLLHNASIYTPEAGTIELTLRKVGKQARLSITDNGVGIRKADQAKLFTKFTRIHNPLSVQAGGSGIGLYLTAEIVRLHGGGVTVESKYGKGTTFAISLPIEQNKHKP